MPSKKAVLLGRKAIEQYRADHPQLYVGGYYKGMHDAHTPLLNTMLAELKKQGFTSNKTNFEAEKTEILAKFFGASELLNLQELGFTSREDFTTRAKVRDKEAMGRKWL